MPNVLIPGFPKAGPRSPWFLEIERYNPVLPNRRPNRGASRNIAVASATTTTRAKARSRMRVHIFLRSRSAIIRRRVRRIISAKTRLKKSASFARYQQKVCKCFKYLMSATSSGTSKFQSLYLRTRKMRRLIPRTHSMLLHSVAAYLLGKSLIS